MFFCLSLLYPHFLYVYACVYIDVLNTSMPVSLSPSPPSSAITFTHTSITAVTSPYPKENINKSSEQVWTAHHALFMTRGQMTRLTKRDKWPIETVVDIPHALVRYAWTGSINLKLQPPKAHITVTANYGTGPVISREYALICITVARTLTFSHAVSVSTFVMFHLHDTYPSLPLLNCSDNAHLSPFSTINLDNRCIYIFIVLSL